MRADTRTAELESLVETAHLAETESTASEVAELHATLRVNEEVIAKTRQELSDWEHRWEDEERRNWVEREASLQQAELDRYRAQCMKQGSLVYTPDWRLWRRTCGLPGLYTTVDAEDNEHLREQLRTLRSDLHGHWQARLAMSQPNQDRQRVDMDGGFGSRAHRTTTISSLGHESLFAPEQTTGLTQTQPDHHHRSAETAGGYGTHARSTAAAREPQLKHECSAIKVRGSLRQIATLYMPVDLLP